MLGAWPAFADLARNLLHPTHQDKRPHPQPLVSIRSPVADAGFCSPFSPLSFQFCAQLCSATTHNRWLQLRVYLDAGDRARGDYGYE